MQRTTAIALGFILLTLPPIVEAGPAGDNSGSGSMTWSGPLGLPLNVDQGSARQSSSVRYDGDVTCSCAARNWLGICVDYQGSGAWVATWWGTEWDGRGSAIDIPGSVSEVVTRVFAEEGVGDACNAALQAGIAAGQAAAELKAQGFHAIYGDATGWTHLGVAVPFTGIVVQLPVRLAWSGYADFGGSLTHWDLTGSGTGSFAGVRLVTMQVNGQSYA